MCASQQHSFTGKGLFPPQYAFTLLLPLRNIFLSPKKLLQRLELKQSHTVLEIGPGPGYFSSHVALRLTQGRLVLLDIQQEMLDYAKKRLTKKNIRNIDYKLTDGNNLNLESSFFDRVFMVTVIGEIDNKELYLKEIHRVLKDDGVLSITELAGDPDKLSIEELTDLVCRYGFTVNRTFGNQRNYTINFSKISFDNNSGC